MNPNSEFNVSFIKEVEKIYQDSFISLGISLKDSMAI